jgi:hypothetical protein
MEGVARCVSEVTSQHCCRIARGVGEAAHRGDSFLLSGWPVRARKTSSRSAVWTVSPSTAIDSASSRSSKARSDRTPPSQTFSQSCLRDRRPGQLRQAYRRRRIAPAAHEIPDRLIESLPTLCGEISHASRRCGLTTPNCESPHMIAKSATTPPPTRSPEPPSHRLDHPRTRPPRPHLTRPRG